MNAVPRLKIIGDEPELQKFENCIRQAAVPFAKFQEIDEACDSQELEAADLFIIGSSNYYQAHLNQIQKLLPAPDVVLVTGGKLPNLAKILVPNIIYSDWPEEEIISQLFHSADIHRRKRRLEALRDHQNRISNTESNPAIHLVTNLMRKCTIAEEYPDLLTAVFTLKSVIEFHDCSLITLDEDGEILDAWHSSRESKDRLTKINLAKVKCEPMDRFMENGEVNLFSSSDPSPVPWDSFTSHPWSFGMSMMFSMDTAPRRVRTARSAVIVLYRRELVPFLERDYWLLELTYGPLALALEKVAMLKAISQASKEWRSTFDGISESLTVIDSQYQIVKANKAFAALVGHDIKKVKGKRCYSLLANRRTPCVGCPVGAGVQAQSGVRIQLQGKSKKDLLVWSYGIRTGIESYHFQFYRNVSKETALASTLIQSEKMAALGRLVGAIAHEINNPLAGILATSQILLSDANEVKDSSVREDIEEIRSAAWRSKKIIDELLGFTSNKKVELEEANLVDAIRSALTFAKSALREVSVKVHSEKAVARAVVSLSSLQQVLFNLIANASQAMNGKGTLEISLKKELDCYRIDVKDNGPGIPPEKLKHIFDPFYTSKQEGMGTGLGLSIVRNLIQKMNAKIEVKSTVGKGTEFSIYVPIQPPSGAAQ